MNHSFVRICFVLAMLGAKSITGLLSTQASELSDRTASAIRKLSSYDVVVDVQQLHYLNAHDSSKPNPSTPGNVERHRDVFAVGLGRRFERHVDQPDHMIAIKDWQMGSKPHALEMSYTIPGLNYFDYFNPNCDGFFLSELLASKESTIDSLEPIQFLDNQLPGFQLTNNYLRGSIRIWVHPKHGFMPARIEVYRQTSEGTAALVSRTEINEFAGVDNNAWAPIEGQVSEYLPSGPEAGRVVMGFKLHVDRNKSHWNSIVSKEPFTIASLPAHNWTQAGWNQYQPPESLRALKAQEVLWKTAMQQDTSNRIWWIVLNLVAILSIVAILIWKRTRPRLGVSS